MQEVEVAVLINGWEGTEGIEMRSVIKATVECVWS